MIENSLRSRQSLLFFTLENLAVAVERAVTVCAPFTNIQVQLLFKFYLIFILCIFRFYLLLLILFVPFTRPTPFTSLASLIY